jgi:16S rRNA (adenine1518-N6/adenine1519-N6)-dimethyltransferase
VTSAPPLRGGFSSPRKSLGQNFLHQAAVIRSIVDAIDPKTDDVVVEIGPGRGALTLPLLEKAGLVHVIELDRKLAGYWAQESLARPNLVVHHANALKVRLDDLVGSGHGARLRVVGTFRITFPARYSSILSRNRR